LLRSRERLPTVAIKIAGGGLRAKAAKRSGREDANKILIDPVTGIGGNIQGWVQP